MTLTIPRLLVRMSCKQVTCPLSLVHLLLTPLCLKLARWCRCTLRTVRVRPLSRPNPSTKDRPVVLLAVDLWTAPTILLTRLRVTSRFLKTRVCVRVPLSLNPSWWATMLPRRLRQQPRTRPSAKMCGRLLMRVSTTMLNALRSRARPHSPPRMTLGPILVCSLMMTCTFPWLDLLCRVATLLTLPPWDKLVTDLTMCVPPIRHGTLAMITWRPFPPTGLTAV